MRRGEPTRRAILYLAPLVLLQAWAHVEQWREGFRPLGRPAHRVAFSWDMFAVETERCAIRFDPKLSIGGRSFPTYASMRPPIEWDVVWDDVADYELAARQLACQHRSTAELTCFVANGSDVHLHVECPR
jgi:hypothetical protein